MCSYKGIEVPALIAFSESGGISGEILTNIFRHLDNLDIYKADRDDGLIPFVLLDGHQSRFDLEFLKYINGEDHRWNVTLGVPYGTALWQVGDSSEQNGKFKMLLTEAKKEIFDERIDSFQQGLHLIRSDIIPLVNKCWPPAFSDVDNSRKAIVERGWWPYNRVLLQHYMLRATMTEEMLRWEKLSGYFGNNLLNRLHNVEYVEDKCKVTLSCRSLTQEFGTELNFRDGATAQYVSTTILTESDRQAARQRSQRLKEEGTTIRERLDKISKKITAGRLVLDVRSYGLTKDVRDHVQRIENLRKDEELAKNQRNELNYMKLCYRADKVIEKNNNDMDITKWRSKADILTLLKPMKNKDDGKFPSSREAIESIFLLWRNRVRKPLSMNDDVLRSFTEWMNEENTKNRGKQRQKK